MSKYQGLGRNDPCWCGSGKKFKKCHLGREQQRAENPYEALKKATAFNQKRVCLHPRTPAECSEKVISAHTVQKGTSLKRIAEDNHVMGWSCDPTAMRRSAGKIGVRRIGINKASTFNGFCSHHDNVTFAPVENEPFTASDEQCFLLGYRALCREFYQKQTALEATGFMRTLDRGRSTGEQIGFQGLLDNIQRGQSAGLRDLMERKTEFDKILLGGSFADVSNYVIFTRDTPDVVATFGVTVQFDFHSRELQNLRDTATPLDSLYVSIIAVETGGAIVFAWRDAHTDACTKFVQSVAAMEDVELPDSVIRLVFKHSENTFFRPSWWKSLDGELQEAIVERVTLAASYKNRESTCLLADGHRYVDWSITQRKTNRQL